MAIALTVSSAVTSGQNKCLLNAWPQALNEDRWHFNQCAGAGAPLQTANDQAGVVYLQKEREDIARHLEQAADRMAEVLNYAIRPLYFSETMRVGKGRPIGNQIHNARWCKMIALGRRAQTLIQAGVAVTYSDPNSIGVNDTATVTVVTAVANAEIKLYFRLADGAPTAGDYRYEIEPTVVTDEAGTVTIKAHRALFVKPTEWMREYAAGDPNYNLPNVVDTANASIGFVTAVDVYRVYTDTAANIQLLDSDNVVLKTYTGYILDNELSAFRLGNLCADVCGGYPAFIRVNYYAGSPLVNGNIDSELYEACCAFAAGRTQPRFRGMSYWALDTWDKWHNPMIQTVSGSIIPMATKKQSESGFGVSRGEVLAWDVVQARAIAKGHKFP
jgi:hypothetical protein